MAVKQYAANDPEAVKLWGRKLSYEVMRQTYFGKFMGEGEDNIIQERTETSKGPGDRVRVTLLAEPAGNGVMGSATLIGNEEALVTFTDDLVIDELRHGFEVPSAQTIEQQRVSFELREAARKQAERWWKTRLDVAMFNQLCGFTAETDLRFTGLQAPLAPTAGRHIFAGAATNDQGLGTNDVMKLSLIDRAVARMKVKDSNGNLRVSPITVNGKPHYVMFLHPFQVHSLRADATTAGNWFDIQKAAMQGGETTNNPIFTGALGVYNGVILHEAESITPGVHSSTGAPVANVRRAIICGAQAAAIGFGRGYGGAKFRWNEEVKDYDKLFGVAATLVHGIKKSRFNGKDFAVTTVSTYAAEP